jgi:hypothetical protein
MVLDRDALYVAGLWNAPIEGCEGGRTVHLPLGIDEFRAGKPSVYGKYRVYLRFEILCHGEASSAWFEGIRFTGSFMHNGDVSPRLMPGRNRYAVSGASALQPVHLAMNWREGDQPRQLEVASSQELHSEIVTCDVEHPYEIRMESVELSGGYS